MANLQEMFTSREFRSADLEEQRAMYSAANSNFARLDREAQDRMLADIEDQFGRSWYEGEFDEAFKRGMAKAKAHWTHMGANAVDGATYADDIRESVGLDPQTDLEKYLREQTELLMEEGTNPEGKNTHFEVGAEMLGQLAVGLPSYAALIGGSALALKAAGLAWPVALAVAGIGVAGFGGGALSESDKGFLEAMKAGTTHAAFFALFPFMRATGAGPGTAATVIGGAGFSLTPEDMELNERIGHGLTAAALGAIHQVGFKDPYPMKPKPAAKVKNTGKVEAMEPEVKAKIMGEAELDKLMRQRAQRKAEQERIAEDRLKEPKSPEEIAAMEEKVSKLPAEERAIVEETRAAEAAADATRVTQVAERVKMLKLQHARTQDPKSKAFIEEEIRYLTDQVRAVERPESADRLLKGAEGAEEISQLDRDLAKIDSAARDEFRVISNRESEKTKEEVARREKTVRDYYENPEQTLELIEMAEMNAWTAWDQRFDPAYANPQRAIEAYEQNVADSIPDDFPVAQRAPIYDAFTDEIDRLAKLARHERRISNKARKKKAALRKKVSSPRGEGGSQGDLPAVAARGRARGGEPEPPPRLQEGDTGKGFRGEEETFRGQFEERFGKMGEFRDEQIPPGGGEGGGRGVLPPESSPAEASTRHISSAGDRKRLEYIDDGHGALWMMRVAGMEDMPDNVYHSFQNLRGIADAQDGMVRWGMPEWIEDPKIPGRKIIRFMPTPKYDVVEVEPGVYQATPSTTEFSRGDAEIIMPIMGKGRKYEDDSWDYFQARRSNELINQTIDRRTGDLRQSTMEEILNLKTREKLWDLDTIRENLAKADPVRVAVYEAMKHAQRQMMKFYVDSGFVTQAQADQYWLDNMEFAFSFQRMKEVGRSGRHRTEDGVTTAYGIRRLHGKKAELRDRFTLYIRGKQDLFRAALQNRWARDTAERALELGGFAERIPAKAQRIQLTRETLRRALMDDMINNEGLTEAQAQARMRWITQMPGDIERIAFFIGANKPYGSDVISYFKDGRPHYVRIFDDVLIRTFDSINRDALVGMAGRWMANFKNFKQEMITIDPTFIISNGVRDPIMATTMTRTGHQHLTAAMNGMLHVIRHSQEFQDWIANGGGGSTVRDGVRLTRRRIIKMAERENRHFLNPRNLLYGPRDMWEFMKISGQAVERASRMGEFVRARRKGLKGARTREGESREGQPATIEEAVFASKEVSGPFQMRGGGKPTELDGIFGVRWGPEAQKFLSHTVPFYNAMMVGADRVYRGTARDPHGKMGTGLKMGLVGVSSVLLEMLNQWMSDKYGHLKDEDGRQMVDYRSIPEWARMVAWHIYMPTEFDSQTGEPTVIRHFHMPKIWEVGMIGSWGERFAREMMETQHADDKALFLDMLDILAHNFNLKMEGEGIPFPLPAGFDIITEQAINQILFTGQPIETRGMGEIQSWARARSGTPRTLQELSKQLRGPELEWVPDVIQSPTRAEALLRGIFGQWANMGLQMTDEVFFPGGAALGWDDVPIIRRFYSEPGKYDLNTELYYKNLERFNQAQGTVRHMANIREREIAQEMRLDPDQKAQIALAPGFDRANLRIQKLNRKIDMVKRGIAEPDATPKERHQILNRLEARRNKIMKSRNEMAKRMQERIRREMEEDRQ